jgi:hypothetical protein
MNINEKEFTNKELKEALQKRISFVTEMIEIGKINVEKPFTRDHWNGYLAALNGTTGELQFLKKLYERVK